MRKPSAEQASLFPVRLKSVHLLLTAGALLLLSCGSGGPGSAAQASDGEDSGQTSRDGAAGGSQTSDASTDAHVGADIDADADTDTDADADADADVVTDGGTRTDAAPSDLDPCGPAHPAGSCDDNGEICRNGQCIDRNLFCSADRIDGLCEDPSETCIDGTCRNPSSLCSPTNVAGLCPAVDVCVSGRCVSRAETCSSSNPSGLCPTGEHCVDGRCELAGSCSACAPSEGCIDGMCRDDELLCSTAHPTGLCDSGFDCVEGTCVDAGIGCSSANQSGVCPTGLLCNAGACEPIDDVRLCDDHNDCTRDAFDFDRNRCIHEPRMTACSDGNACTQDACVDGACVGTSISGCIAPPTVDDFETPTNVGELHLSGTKPAGASVRINDREAVAQDPETRWQVALNLSPGENIYVIKSVHQGAESATLEIRVVYDLTPPVTSLTPSGGVYLNALTVRAVSNESSTVYYTTDGSTPDEFSSHFESVKAFRVFDPSKLKFRAKDDAGNWETRVVTATYEITGHGNGWVEGPAMSSPLIHAAALTLGSSVYVVGGSDGRSAQTDASVYDANTQSWTTLPSLATGRAQLTLATTNGRLYAIGGESDGAPLGTVDVLNTTEPASWTALAPMPTTRYGLASVLIGNNIHVLGGKTNGGAVLRNHEVFDTASNAWSNRVAEMPRPRYAFGAVYHARKVYLVGGEDESGTPIAEVDVYDVASDSWSQAAPMPTPRSFAAVVVLRNGGEVSTGDVGILVAGGRQAGGAPSVTVEEYLIERNVWRERTPLDAPRVASAGAAFNHRGDVDTETVDALVLGGQSPAGLLASSSAFHRHQDYVRVLRPMPEGRFMHAAVASNDRIYLFGGRNFTEEVTAWRFDPETETYREIAPLPSYQNGLGAAAVDDVVYALGGADNFGNAVATVRAYDPVRDEWIERAPLQTARKNAAVTVVDDEIWVIGGENRGALQTVEIYRPATDRWRSAPTLPAARMGSVAVTYRGDVYLAGGETSDGVNVPSLIRFRVNSSDTSNAWSTVSGDGFLTSYGGGFKIGRERLAIFAGRAHGAPVADIVGYGLQSGQPMLPMLIQAQNLLMPRAFSASAALYGNIYLFGGDASAALGPSGVTRVEKVLGHCFNGLLDPGESGVDAGDGCPVHAYAHATGYGGTFYNQYPPDTTSLERAIDACNAHYGSTSCRNHCSSGSACRFVSLSQCSCYQPRWSYSTHDCHFSRDTSGEVLPSTCSSEPIGHWN